MEQTSDEEDELEEDRGKFVDMMKHLLWLSEDGARLEEASHEALEAERTATSSVPVHGGKGSLEKENIGPKSAATDSVAPVEAKGMNRNKKKRAKKQAKEVAAPKPESDRTDSTARIEVNETKFASAFSKARGSIE